MMNTGKKAAAYLLAAAVFVGALSVPALADEPPAVSAQSAVVMHADTGTVVYAKNTEERMLVASTTKIMTAYVVLNSCGLDETVEAEYEWALTEGSSMYIKPGETYTVEQLLYGLMLASGNDAAVALACHVSGSIEAFAELMNRTAAELGLENTHFENPHGLDGENHYSTAADMAKLMAAAMANEDFRQIVSTRSYTVGDQTYVNHNKLLWSCDGVIGGKTGYTMAAGRILVSCAERDGMRIICVTISDPDDWNDHIKLYDWAYDTYCYSDVLPFGAVTSVEVVSGTFGTASAEAHGPLRVFRRKNSQVCITTELPRFVYAPVSSGALAGKLTVTVDGENAGETQLYFTQDVGMDEGEKLTFWERIKRGWYMANRSGYYYYGPYMLSLAGGNH